MKFNSILITAFLFCAFLAPSAQAAPLTALLSEAAIARVLGGPGTDPTHPAANLIDSDPATI